MGVTLDFYLTTWSRLRLRVGLRRDPGEGGGLRPSPLASQSYAPWSRVPKVAVGTGWSGLRTTLRRRGTRKAVLVVVEYRRKRSMGSAPSRGQGAPHFPGEDSVRSQLFKKVHKVHNDSHCSQRIATFPTKMTIGARNENEKCECQDSQRYLRRAKNVNDLNIFTETCLKKVPASTN